MFSNPVTTGTHLWVRWYDRTTLRPAIAVSNDAGVTWTMRELPGAAPVPQATLPNGELDPHQVNGLSFLLIAGDGPTAYAAIWDGSSTPAAPIPGAQEDLGWLRTYRTTDGGLTWQAVAPGSTMPAIGCAWLTADGRLVVGLPRQDGTPGYVYAVSADGITYTPAEPPGLPAQLKGIDGTTAFTEQDVYTSTDGWTWQKA